MKTNKNIFLQCLSFTLLFSVYACNLVRDPLDTYSDVTESVGEDGVKIAFKDRAAVQSHMVTLYNQMRDRQEHWYLDALAISEIHSDNAYAGTTGAEVVPYETNSIEGSNSIVNRDWNRFLEDVARANKLIVNIDKVQDQSLTQAERIQYKAEAQIFRSMIFFDMVRLWGAIPLIITEAGDIKSETIGDVYKDYFPKQSTEVEVYKQMEKDLQEALVNAPANNNADKTRFSKSVARALLAKIYAEEPIRDYNKVIQYCDELSAEGFGLVDDYSDLFGTNATNTDAKMRNTKESILEAQFFSGSGNWVTWMFGRDLANYNNNFTWAKWVTPSRDLIKAFQNEGDVVRYQQSIVYYETTWSNHYPSNNYPFMYKCRSAYNSIIKLRFADILLLKAEALIRKDGSDLAAAADIIDQIRQRAGGLAKLSGTVRNDKEAMTLALLKERRLELAFEGQRWFDLVRLNRVEQVMNTLSAKDPGRKNLAYSYGPTSYKLPIPQAVIDQNPNIVQNPGY